MIFPKIKVLFTVAVGNSLKAEVSSVISCLNYLDFVLCYFHFLVRQKNKERKNLLSLEAKWKHI